jgi:hypothetical protein
MGRRHPAGARVNITGRPDIDPTIVGRVEGVTRDGYVVELGRGWLVEAEEHEVRSA